MTLPLPDCLQTPRLTVRPLRADDLAAVFACYNHVEVGRYCSPVRWPDMDFARDWFARRQVMVGEGKAQQFVTVLTATDAIIGTCVLFNLDPANRRGEVGYALGHAHWSNGYAREAVTGLIEHGISALNLHRIEAQIDPRNNASSRLVSSLGFQLEGILKDHWFEDGEFVDTAIYGLLATNWRAARSSKEET